MNDKERKCEHCKYYIAHYVVAGTGFLKIFDGHCGNSTLIKLRVRNKYALQSDCIYWESDESRKEQTRESIKEALRNIEKHLNCIKNILINET